MCIRDSASIVPALYSRKIPKAEDERLGRNGRLFLQHARAGPSRDASRFSPPARALEHSPNEAGSPELHSVHARVLLGASTDGGHVRRIRREVLLIALLT